MTRELFREDGYMRECLAKVVRVDEEHVVFDRTVFYPLGGGQPGDHGVVVDAHGRVTPVLDTYTDRDSGDILHKVESSAGLAEGDQVNLKIDWPRRHRIMRLHSCMHMLCAVIPAPVTGGSIRDDGSARLDFDLPDPPDKVEVEKALNSLTTGDHAMSIQWISDQELEAQPELVRTMSVQPPTGHGRVRLVKFDDADLQPCGGTHVANSLEIGPVRIRKIEKKGKMNRRIIVELA
jgi:misacylated tRNA(Ala) deacylase